MFVAVLIRVDVILKGLCYLWEYWECDFSHIVKLLFDHLIQEDVDRDVPTRDDEAEVSDLDEDLKELHDVSRHQIRNRLLKSQ